MAKVYKSSLIEARLESVWEYVRDFNGLPKWFPGVTDSHIEAGVPADQVGCVRNFGLTGGPRVRERLLALSDHGHACTYTMVESPMPVSNYVATLRLLPVTDGNRTFSEYTAEFDCPPGQEKELITFFGETCFQAAFEKLKHHFGDS